MDRKKIMTHYQLQLLRDPILLLNKIHWCNNNAMAL